MGSRHRSKNVEYDDYSDEYDDYGTSPASYGVSPSMAGYMIDRSKGLRNSSLGAFLTPEHDDRSAPAGEPDDYFYFDEHQGGEGGDDYSGGMFELDGEHGQQQFPSQISHAVSARPAAPSSKATATAAKKAVDLSRTSSRDSAFRFDTESPDDVVLNRQRQAFQRKGATKTSATPPPKTATPPPKTATPPPKQPAKTSYSSASNKSSSSSSLSSSSSAASSSSVVDTTTDLSSVASSSQGDLRRSTGGAGKILKAKQRTAGQQKKVEESMRSDKGKAQKGHVNLVTIGHVDAGKSTLLGGLLYRLGYVDSKTMHRHERESEQMGKASFALAWIMDAEGEERERGVTIDVSVNYLETERLRVTLLDAPGHRDFVPKMLTGCAQADVALLLIDAVPGRFEAGFQAGGQTQEHALLAHALGVGHLIVVVNKLDAVAWSQERFTLVSEQLTAFLGGQVGFRNVQFVPVSALHGTNVVERPSAAELPELQWYTGPTLLQAIDATPVPQRPVQKPFRLSIADAPSSSVLCGRIQTGVVAPGDTLLVMPLHELCTVRHVKKNGGDADFPYAVAGDNVDLFVTGINPQSFVSPGSFLCDPEHPVPVVSQFIAKIYTFDVPNLVLLPGTELIMHSGTNKEPVQISRLIAQLDSQGQLTRSKPKKLFEKSFALVKISVLDSDKTVCLEKFEDFKQLGRFLLRQGAVSIAQGVVTEFLSQKFYTQ